MSMTKRPPSRFASPRHLANCLMVIAVASAATLTGCQSALTYNGVDRGSSQYADSLIARAVLQGTYHGEFGQDPTIPQGVRELPRVDSSGPATAPADAAVEPMNTAATHPNDLGSPPPSTLPAQPEAAGNGTMPASALATQPLGTSTPVANDVGLDAARLNAPEPVFNLSLQDAIARALKNALDIKVEAYNPGIQESKLIQQEAAFDPVVFGSSQYNNTNEPALGTVTNPHTFRSHPGFVTNVSDGQVWQNQIGIRRLLPSGGTAEVSAGDTWRNLPITNGLGFPIGESWNPNLNATFTQPLLRGFGTAITEANIYLAQRDRRIALETFRRQVITSVANVEEAYHNLVLARTNVDIEEQLLAATEDTYKRVHDRIAVDADQISVSQAQAAVEQRRAELVRGRIALREQSDKLKSLLNDPEINIRHNALINPTDKPIAEPVVFNTADAIETALRQRTELQEDRLKLEQSDINLTIARNDLLPKLDLTASVQTTGLANDFEASFGSTVTGHYIDYAAGIKLEFPLGNRAAEAEVRQRTLERNQLMTKTVLDAQTVVADVKQQLHELLGSYQEVQARERARIAAADELKAITQKEAIVALTPEFLQLKLDAQNLLASSEQSEIQAIINYNLALMRLEQAKGTLLEFDRISLDRAPIYRPEDDFNRIRFLGKTYKLTK